MLWPPCIFRQFRPDQTLLRRILWRKMGLRSIRNTNVRDGVDEEKLCPDRRYCFWLWNISVLTDCSRRWMGAHYASDLMYIVISLPPALWLANLIDAYCLNTRVDFSFRRKDCQRLVDFVAPPPMQIVCLKGWGSFVFQQLPPFATITSFWALRCNGRAGMLSWLELGGREHGVEKKNKI